jgi:hypothetical protein
VHCICFMVIDTFVMLQAMEHVAISLEGLPSSVSFVSVRPSVCRSVFSLRVYSGYIALWFGNRTLDRRCSWSDARCCIAMPGACFINPGFSKASSHQRHRRQRHVPLAVFVSQAQTPASLPSIMLMSYSGPLFVVQRRIQSSYSLRACSHFLEVSGVILSAGPGRHVILARVVHFVFAGTTKTVLL